MLKRYWYWWTFGLFLFLVLISGGSSTNSSQSSTLSSNNALSSPLEEFENVSTFNISTTSSSEHLETQPASGVQSASTQINFDSSVSEEDIIEEEMVVVVPALYQVIRVIDGDTIEVMYEGEKRSVRYIGVDTPETVHPSKPVECMGKEASTYNSSLVAGKKVRLVKDVSDTDRYGRLLRYVYVGDVMVNELLVKEGYANVMTYPPDVKYNQHFLTLEQEARLAKKGLWSDVCAEYVATSAVSSPVVHANPNDLSCRIKGNISSSKEKIFHVPGCQSYEKTVINEDTGERWFCTEQEALNAGWRKALNCG
ncbi:MAG: thermonuclease family protein [Candidatus Paceibacteria bacterium]